jgi:hypothetical protein
MSGFKWGKKQEIAAIALANGDTQQEAADKANTSERTIRRWLAIAEFAEEVDRLTFLTGVANKAERIRLAKRVINTQGLRTEKDLLDWLKYVQGETDGVKLDFTELISAIAANDAKMADSGPRDATRALPQRTAGQRGGQ